MTLKEAQSYSTYELRKLAADAQYRNDKDALATLTQINLRLKREANNRLERLERAGYKQYAYDLATTYTRTAYKTNRFKGIEITDPTDLRKQIVQMQTFLSKRTSFVVGQKEVEKARYDAFRAKPAFKGVSDIKLKKFLKFMGNRTIRDFVNEGSFESGEHVDLLFGKWTPSKQKELIELLDRWNATEEGLLTPEDEDYLAYNELKDLLKSKNKLPKKKGKR